MSEFIISVLITPELEHRAKIPYRVRTECGDRRYVEETSKRRIRAVLTNQLDHIKEMILKEVDDEIAKREI